MNEGISVLQDQLITPTGYDIYEQYRYKLRLQNCANFPYKSNPEDLTATEIERLRRRAETNGQDLESLKIGACSSPEAWFSIMLPSVSRQNYYEQALYDELQSKLSEKYSITILPNACKNSLHLINGKIFTKEEAVKSKLKSKAKSIDMKIESNNNPAEQYYLIAKYTTGVGGGQDNQFNDAKAFLSEQTKDGVNLIFVLDGDYYTKEKYDEIKSLAKFTNISIGNYEQIIEQLK